MYIINHITLTWVGTLCPLRDELKMKRKSWTVKFIILVEYNDAAIANADISVLQCSNEEEK
jgi:hypothetical protein